MQPLIAIPLVLALSSPALAQQAAPDPGILQILITETEQQRNEAMVKAAVAQHRVMQLEEEVRQLKAEAARRDAERPKENP